MRPQRKDDLNVGKKHRRAGKPRPAPPRHPAADTGTPERALRQGGIAIPQQARGSERIAHAKVETALDGYLIREDITAAEHQAGTKARELYERSVISPPRVTSRLWSAAKIEAGAPDDDLIGDPAVCPQCDGTPFAHGRCCAMCEGSGMDPEPQRRRLGLALRRLTIAERMAVVAVCGHGEIVPGERLGTLKSGLGKLAGLWRYEEE